MGKVLEVKDLVTTFRIGKKEYEVLRGISFDINENETVCMVGESGCGKSVTTLSVMDLLPNNGRVVSGSIKLNGQELTELSPKERNALRGKQMGMIFQEPMTALDPMYTIEDQIVESLRFHTDMNKAQMHEAALDMLKKVKIPRPEQILTDYPHHLSGGMLQRVMIAAAIISRPRLLLADEPTTALDVTIQAQILSLLRKLNREQGMAVLYAGQVVEEAGVDEIFHNTAHPYTVGLLRSVTSLGGAQKELYAIRGTVPTAGNFSAGCRFADRCEHCMSICREQAPKLVEVSHGHKCRCWLHTGITREEAAQ